MGRENSRGCGVCALVLWGRCEQFVENETMMDQGPTHSVSGGYVVLQ